MQTVVQNTSRGRWEEDLLPEQEPEMGKAQMALMHLSQQTSLSPLVRGVRRKFPGDLGNKGIIVK